MLSSPKRGPLEAIRVDILRLRYDKAEKLYLELLPSTKDTPDAIFYYACILQGKKQFEAALDQLGRLPSGFENFDVIRKKGQLLFALKDYDKALTVFNNPNFAKRTPFRLARIECHVALRQITEAKNLCNQLPLTERKNPYVAKKLAYIYCSLKEENPGKAITFIPDYIHNVELVKTLINIYGKLKQYYQLKSLFTKLSDKIKEEPQILIVYVTAMLSYRGDAQTKEQILKEMNLIILKLLKKELPYSLQRKLIITILREHLQEEEEYKPYISRFVQKNPKDIFITSQVNSQSPADLEDALLKSSPDEKQIRQQIHEATQSSDYPTADRYYQILLVKDKKKERCQLWAQYAHFLTTAEYLEKAISLYVELQKKYPTYSLLYSGLASCHGKNNNIPAQFNVLKEGHQKFPDDYILLNQLIRILNDEEKFQESLDLALAFSNRNPNHIEIKSQLAFAYCHLGLASLGVQLLQKSLEKSPHDHSVIAGLGYCLMVNYDFDRLNAHFRKYSNHELYWTNFVEIQIKSLQIQGKHEEAFDIVKTMHLKREKCVESYIFLMHFFCKAAEQKIRFKEASTYIENALETFPNQVKLLIVIGFYYFDVGSIEAANTYCQQALKLDPNDINGKILKNKILQKQNKPISKCDSFKELVDQCWDAAFRRDGRSFKAILEKLQRLYPKKRKTYYFWSKYYSLLGSYKEAESFLQQIKDNYGSLTVEESLELVWIYRFTARLKEGINLLTEILESSPKNIEVLLQLSFLYEYNNDIDKASEICFKIIKIVPDEIRALVHLAALAQRKKATLALSLKYLEKAENVRPMEVTIALRKASVLNELKRQGAALDVLLKVYKENAEHILLLVEIFNSYHNNNQLEQAKEYIERLMDLYPSNSDAQCAYIRYIMTVEKQEGYDKIEEIYHKLLTMHPHKREIAFEYALFAKRKLGLPKAIVLLEKAIESGPCQFYAKAYTELAIWYVNNKDLEKAEKIYQKGIALFEADIFLNKDYLFFLLFILKQDQASAKAIQFYKNFCKKFKGNHLMLAGMDQTMHMANLQDHIPANHKQEKILCQSFFNFSLKNNPVEELLEKIQKAGYKAYCIGGYPRWHYRKHILKVKDPLFKDIDFYTDAPMDVLQSLFPQGFKSYHISNLFNFHYYEYPININCINIQIENLEHYLRSQMGLNMDCLVMDGQKIFDPTKKAMKGLEEGIIDLVGDVQDTCRENPILLFRILCRQYEYRAILSKQLNGKVLSQMAVNLKRYVQPGKIMAEIAKILTRGYAYDAFNTLIENGLLEIINPTLFACLQQHMFKEWFFAQIAQTDHMVNSVGLMPSKHYVTAVYLIAQLFELFYQSEKTDLDDELIEELLCKTFGDRQERPQLRQHLYLFFSLFKDYFDEIYCPSVYEKAPEEDAFNPPLVYLLDSEELTNIPEESSSEQDESQKSTEPMHLNEAFNDDESILDKIQEGPQDLTEAFQPNVNDNSQNGPKPMKNQTFFGFNYWPFLPTVPSLPSMPIMPCVLSIVDTVKSYMPSWQTQQSVSPISPLIQQNNPKKKRQKKKRYH